MIPTSENNDNCTIFEELIESPLDELNVEQHNFINEHIKWCELCRMEYNMLAKIHSIEPPQFNDIAKRKIINNAISIVENSENKSIENSFSKNVKVNNNLHKSNLGKLIIAASVIFIIIAGGFLFNLKLSPKNKVSTDIGTGKSLLVSGLVKLNNKPLSSHLSIKPGAKIETKNGRSTFFIPASTYVMLQENSLSSLTKINSDEVNLKLMKGEIVASVLRDKKDPVFTVTSPHGKVFVTGTVFSVEVKAYQTTVSVISGSVKFKSGKKTIIISSGESFNTKSQRISKIPPEKLKLYISNNKIMEILNRGETSVEFISEPNHSKVFIGNTYLGITPLSAQFRHGHRLVTFKNEGYDPVTKYYEFKKNEHEKISITHKLSIKTAGITSHDKDTEVSKPNKKTLNTTGVNIVKIGNAKKTNKLRSNNKRIVKPIDNTTKTKSILPNSTEPIKKPNPKPATILFRKANSLRMQKKWKKAGNIYSHIISKYPNSGEALISYVSYGLLLQKRLRKPKLALKYLSLYLTNHSNGILAQEAVWGRILVFRQLGNKIREKAELIKFLKKWPNSLLVDQAKYRLNSLKK